MSEQQFNDPNSDHVISEAIDGKSKISLVGVVRNLILNDKVDGQGFLDASQLKATNVTLKEKVDGMATVQVCATELAKFEQKIDGHGVVSASGKTLEFNQEVNGHAVVTVTASKEVTFSGRIDGEARVFVVLGKNAVLRIADKVDGKAIVQVVKLDASATTQTNSVAGSARVIEVVVKP